MMTLHKKEAVLRALRSRTDLELSAAEMEQMLVDELARPAEEMDTELVSMLTELLEDAVSDASQHHAWQRAARRLQRRTAPVTQRVLRIAAVLIAAAGLAGLTWHAAEAINDRFLLREEIPGTSTFVVMSNPDAATPTADVPPANIDPQLIGSYTVVTGDDYSRAIYDSLADCPQTLYGYPVVPAWVPDGYEHVSSVYYEDWALATVNHHFMRNGESLVFDVTIYTHPNIVVYSETQMANDLGYETYSAGVPVFYYWYGKQAIPCANYFHGRAEYNICGPITHEEMRVIIEATMDNVDWRNEP